MQNTLPTDETTWSDHMSPTHLGNIQYDWAVKIITTVGTTGPCEQ